MSDSHADRHEPLGVPGETVVRVASLDERDATELFVLRARSAYAAFEPAEADGAPIAAMPCQVHANRVVDA